MLLWHGFDRASQPPLASADHRVEAGSDLASPDHIRTISCVPDAHETTSVQVSRRERRPLTIKGTYRRINHLGDGGAGGNRTHE